MAHSSRTLRQMLEAKYNFLYATKFKHFRQCLYCGEPATDREHVFPVSRLATLDLRSDRVIRELRHCLYIVPSCSECNSIAGSKPFFSIKEKRKFIQVRLAKKYRKLICGTDWETHELDELGDGLRTSVMSSIVTAYKVQRRLSWPKPDIAMPADLVAYVVMHA